MSWQGRVSITNELGGFAYRPGEIITRGDAAAAVVSSIPGAVLLGEMQFPELPAGPDPDADARYAGREDGGAEGGGRRTWESAPAVTYRLFRASVDVPSVVGRLRASLGSAVQPNHVLFAAPVYPSPVYPSGVGASPVYPSPVYPSPVYPSPVYPSPVYPSPVYPSGAGRVQAYETFDAAFSPVPVHPAYASPASSARFRATGIRRSTAMRADPIEGTRRPVEHPAVRVAVVDTGYPSAEHAAPFRSGSAGLFAREGISVDDTGAVGGAIERPDVVENGGDGHLDPAAGHGAFIAGIIEHLAPGTRMHLHRAFHPEGDGSEWNIGRLLDALRAEDPALDLLNLSFSGYVLDDEPQTFLGEAIARMQHEANAGPHGRKIVVAAAGNEATGRPTYPATYPGVIGVAAIGPLGPAPFSNFGPWVRACAPGVDLVSTFFTKFPGAPNLTPDDPDHFDGWARWSGTSFATPVVVGALALQIQGGLTTTQAVAQVIDAPGLARIPYYGTIVNMI